MLDMAPPTRAQEWIGSPVQSCTQVDSEMCSKEQKSSCPPPSSYAYIWKTPKGNISWKRLIHSVFSNSSCLKNPVWGKVEQAKKTQKHLSSYQFILLCLKCSQYKALDSDQYNRDCWNKYTKLLHSNDFLLLLSINTLLFLKKVCIYFTFIFWIQFCCCPFRFEPRERKKRLLFKFYFLL